MLPSLWTSCMGYSLTVTKVTSVFSFREQVWSLCILKASLVRRQLFNYFFYSSFSAYFKYWCTVTVVMCSTDLRERAVWRCCHCGVAWRQSETMMEHVNVVLTWGINFFSPSFVVMDLKKDSVVSVLGVKQCSSLRSAHSQKFQFLKRMYCYFIRHCHFLMTDI